MSVPQLLVPFGGNIETAIAFWKNQSENHPGIDPLLNLQVLLNAAGKEEEGFKVSDQQLALDSEDPRVHFNRGWHLLNRGRFNEGFACLEKGRILNTFGNPSPGTSKPLWSGQDLNNKKILFYLEGGFGDEIIAFRFVQNLRKKGALKVFVACRPQLVRFFRAQGLADAVLSHEEIESLDFDFWLPGMSAPRLLELSPECLEREPYLKANPQLSSVFKNFVNEKAPKGTLKVGLRWSGNPQFENQQLRKFPIELLLALREIPGIQLYSFQRDNDLISLPAEICDLSRGLITWSDTAAALSSMDLMISSCTSVAHLAGALGVRTWVLVPVMPYYIWAHWGEQSLWYKNVRLFRQKKFGAWDQVRDEVREALITLKA